MNKVILVLINGRAGVGKDTFVELCKSYANKDCDNCVVCNVHRSDIAKQMLRAFTDWDGTKDEDTRTILKQITDFLEKKDYLTKRLDFMLSNAKRMNKSVVLFYHVREPKVIYSLMDRYMNTDIFPLSLLVKRDTPNQEPGWWDIESADYCMTLNLPIDDLECTKNCAKGFMDFVINNTWTVRKGGNLDE